MKRTLIILLTIIVLSCNNRRENIQIIDNKNLNEKQKDSILNEYNFKYSRIVFVDSIEKIIIPITTQKDIGGSRLSKVSYKEDYSYSEYWNLIFYDIKSGKTKLLTNKKTRIYDFETNLNNVGTILKNSVLYKICDTDFNLDKKLNFEDTIQLFISNVDGENFKRISPSDENLIEYQIVPNTDKIIFKTSRDVNNDKVFNEKDEVIWYLIDLSAESKPIEIIDINKRKEIKNLYFEQWLVKEK